MKFFPLEARTFTYQLAHFLAERFFSLVLQGEAEGIENLPKEGPVLIAGNHLSLLDPPMFGGILPRESYFFARNTLFKPGFVEKRLHELNAIPVRRDEDSDVGALKKTLKVLKEGEALIYFPEGTRSLDGKLQRAKPGIGLIACKTRAPVLPARIFNSHIIAGGKSHSMSLRHPISIVYGKLLQPEDYDPGHSHPDRYQEAADRILAAIARLEPVNPPSV
jgi:1-acyl-sn-glycerol-3-phosphate acyltransferase